MDELDQFMPNFCKVKALFWKNSQIVSSVSNWEKEILWHLITSYQRK